jgi:hypothetical protein
VGAFVYLSGYADYLVVHYGDVDGFGTSDENIWKSVMLDDMLFWVVIAITCYRSSNSLIDSTHSDARIPVKVQKRKKLA